MTESTTTTPDSGSSVQRPVGRIGVIIKERRKSLEMSQQDLANAVGLNVSEISHYETGRREPSINSLILLSQAFHCRVGDFFDEKPAPKMVICHICSGSGCIPETVQASMHKEFISNLRFRLREKYADAVPSNAQHDRAGTAPVHELVGQQLPEDHQS